MSAVCLLEPTTFLRSGPSNLKVRYRENSRPELQRNQTATIGRLREVHCDARLESCASFGYAANRSLVNNFAAFLIAVSTNVLSGRSYTKLTGFM